MRKNVFGDVLTELQQILGAERGSIGLEIVGDDQMSLHVPEGTIPGYPGVTIEAAPPCEIVPRCKKALGF